MPNLVDGLKNFKKSVYPQNKSLFERLAQKQTPESMFITCSDSRIVPGLMTQTGPGDLFVLRNAGNIVPRNGGDGKADSGGEAASVEYAVRVLKVREIIVCGHTKCGAMAGLMDASGLDALPCVASWLSHAAPVRQRVLEKHADLDKDTQLRMAIEENVRLQLENLRTYPAVSEGIEQGTLQLRGWVYDIATGDVNELDSRRDAFVCLTEIEESIT